jgi:peptidoglycan-N-acetylglucosamine deacetylase
VALTFDFGGRVGDALAIVRYLEAQHVDATVFSTGAQADLAATDATVRQVFTVVCGSAHLTLGNHSMTHADFASLAPDAMRTQLLDAEAALGRVCPEKSPRPLFRPPNGSLGGWRTATYYGILDAVGSAGYSRTVTWDIDTLDWGAPGTTYYRSAGQIAANVESNGRGGSIVLMHLGGYETLEAIQVLVPWLRASGYRLVDLHEMLGV